MKIKELRLQKNVSQKEAAEQLGCTTSQYYKYEAEVRQPSIDMLIRMSEYFGTSIDYIVENPVRLSNSLSAYETKLVELARKADGRAREDALLLLENNPLEKNE